MNQYTIRDLREQLNLTQEQFAERVGVHRVTVARWETGARTPIYRSVLANLNKLVKGD